MKKSIKRGPKLRPGETEPRIRKSVSIPPELWDWCEQRAHLTGLSISEYIVMKLRFARGKSFREETK